MAPIQTEVDPARRFGGIDRLYGAGSIDALHAAHACVIGVGGVGSWAVEALARSGVGRLTLIDLDHVAESNINRQAHALDATLGMAKVGAMAARIAGIHPACRVELIEDFVTPENAGELLHGFDVVIDAIDNVRAKVAIAAICRQRRIPLVMAGGAGGESDPARICVDPASKNRVSSGLARAAARSVLVRVMPWRLAISVILSALRPTRIGSGITRSPFASSTPP